MRWLVIALLTLFTAGAIAQTPDIPIPLAAPSKTDGNIAIWRNVPGVGPAIGDTGSAVAPGDLGVVGNLNVTGTITGNAATGNSIPGLGGVGPVNTTLGAVPIENWGVTTTGNPTENATKIAQALTESSNNGVAVYLTGRYPTTAITVTGCPVLIGSGPRSGLIYNATVPDGFYGLSIICPISTPRHQLLPPSMTRLSNFGMWTTVANGGKAIYLQVNYKAGVHPRGPVWMSAFVDHLFIGGDNNCGLPNSGGDAVECRGSVSPPHYWSAGITGLNLPQVRFTNNIIYGTAEPTAPGTPPEPASIYAMQYGVRLAGGNGENCDTPVFAQNTIIGTHAAIYYEPGGGLGARGCEGWRIENNLLHRNDYNIFMNAMNLGYEPPGLFVIGNEMESQNESIWLQAIAKVFIAYNTIDIGQGYAGNLRDTGSCMFFYFVNNLRVNNNHCTNIGSSGLGNAYGGPGSTGIIVSGATGSCPGHGTNCRSRWGWISDNSFEFFEGGVHLMPGTQEIYSVGNYMVNSEFARPDLAPTTPPSQSGRYFYRDDSENPAGTKVGWNYLSMRCGNGDANGGQRSGLWRGGFRRSACSGGTATTGIFGAPEPGAGGP